VVITERASLGGVTSIALVPPPILSSSSRCTITRQADDGFSVNELSSSLSRLIRASSPQDSDAAWRAFVAEHSRLVLHACRSVWRSTDDAMDAYADVLDHLHADDFRRLREFATEPRSRVSTWLVVVSRRIALDLYRRRYGRAGSDVALEQRRARRRLQDLIAEQLELHDHAGPEGDHADTAIRRAELHDALRCALAALAPRDVLLLKLRFAEDLSAQAIAPMLEMPSPFHVYRRLNALLAELRRTLGRRGVESALP
jgi:RNA polymerase sigma factor (sigma-70 family)